MDNRVGMALIAALLVTLTATAVGFSILQGEINNLNDQISEPTVYPTTNQTSTTESPNPQPTTNSTLQQYRHAYVVYTFNLKPEYINNTDWLGTQIPYNRSLSWKENYIAYLANLTTYPDQMKDSTAHFMFNFDTKQFVSAQFDVSTGKTKATYNYIEYNGVAEINSIEYSLPSLNDGQGWNKTYE